MHMTLRGCVHGRRDAGAPCIHTAVQLHCTQCSAVRISGFGFVIMLILHCMYTRPHLSNRTYRATRAVRAHTSQAPSHNASHATVSSTHTPHMAGAVQGHDGACTRHAYTSCGCARVAAARGFNPKSARAEPALLPQQHPIFARGERFAGAASCLRRP